MSLNEKLKQAEAEEVAVRTRVSELRAEARRLANEKLVGKCFRYENSYSATEKWWMYTCVTGIAADGRLLGSTCQQATSGQITFENEWLSEHILSGSSEISLAEYRLEARLLIAKAQKMTVDSMDAAGVANS